MSDGRPSHSLYDTLGMMGSLGHERAFGQMLKGEVSAAFLAWFIRRTYYLLQMPGWGRRLHIMIDWTFALLFRPDIVKISFDSEAALLLRELRDEEAIRIGEVAKHDKDGRFSGTQLGAPHPAESMQTAGISHATGGGA